MNYKEMTLKDIAQMAKMYVETFNAAPWHDAWTIQTASKRLHQMMSCEGFYGLLAYEDETLCGMILGNEEQYYNGRMFQVKEMCVCNKMRHQGIGSKLFDAFEKQLKVRGIDEMILFTLRDDSTRGFYEKRGLTVYEGMVMMGKHIK